MQGQRYEISLIAAMNKDRVIGADGDIPWRVQSDMRYFKDTTMGHDVIMGRKTYESIRRWRPGGEALPGRHVIVLSRNMSDPIGECTVVRSLESAIGAARMPRREIFVAGGGLVYEQFLSRASRLYLTYIDATIEGSDSLVRFPAWNASDWVEERHEVLESRSELDEPRATAYVLRLL